MSLRRLRTLALLLVLLGLSSPAPAFGQATTAAFDPAVVSSQVEIGPVTGWTTTWHPAPLVISAPLGTTLQLRVRVPPGGDALWTGAREVETLQGRSVSEVSLTDSNVRQVEVQVVGSSGEFEAHTLTFEPYALAGNPAFERPRLVVEPLAIDAGNPNASTMALYFQGSSIAALGTPEPGVYRTSTNRWITLESRVTPEALAPLVEWRLDGKVLPQLGTRVRLQVFTTGRHTLAAGTSDSVTLETYRVRLTSPRRGEIIPTETPVTFTAVTDPPGFESEITWLASTKYGHCEPLLGLGPEFTTTFSQTVGESGSWLGVRADDAILGLDRKNDDCASFQRAAAAALTVLPPQDDLPEGPPAYRGLVERVRELAEDTASGAVCGEDRLDRVVSELGGLNQGFTAGFNLSELANRVEPCFFDCQEVATPGCPDPNNVACEWAIACIGTCVPPGPDLRPTFFEDDTTTPCSTVISNFGTSSAGPSRTTLQFSSPQASGSQPDPIEIPALTPGVGSRIDVLSQAPNWCSFDCYVTIRADASNAVAESNEANNLSAECRVR